MDPTENPSRSSIANKGGFEENIMAILDSTGAKQARDLHDDRLSFLEAVRTSFIVPDSPSAPSWNMLNATFRILRDSRSLELAMTSYQLLTDLHKCYPRVYLTNLCKLKNLSRGMTDLVLVNEAWSPFNVGPETAHREGDGGFRNSHELIDFSTVEDMLLFQYLVNVLETDFVPRQTLYKEILNWVLLKESILNMLLVSRKLKSLVRNCMLMISTQWHHHAELQLLKDADNAAAKVAQDCDFALAIAVMELQKETFISVRKLLTLIMELDAARKEADLNGSTSRADGLRTPLLEIILDELTYNKDIISPFLVVFSEPRWKLELILQYFTKYFSKPSIRTRRSTESPNDVTFEGLLGYFSTPASTKNNVKKITPDVAQLLLAHAFQAYLSLQHDVRHLSNFSDKIGGITLSMACRSLISAFQNLRKIDEDLGVASFEEEAWRIAGAILLTKGTTH